MTNRKLKPGKVGKNMTLLRLAKTNTQMLARLIITAVQNEGISKPRIRELLDIYQEYYVPKFEQLCTDDMQNVTVRRELRKIGIEFSELSVLKFPDYTDDMQTVFRENAGIFCVMLSDQQGFGQKRIRRLISAASKVEGDPLPELHRILGYELDDLVLPDVTDYADKKEKFTRGELLNMKNGLIAFREIQRANHEGGNIS